MENGLSKLFEYGIAGIVIAILFYIVWRWSVWIMGFIKSMTEQHNEERRTWIAVIDSLKISIETHNLQSVEARRQQTEAHEYQRKEHEKLQTSMDKTCVCLTEIEKGLVRINGYK